MTRIATILACLALPFATLRAAEEPLLVFVLAGQSNMDGRAQVADLPADLKAEQAQVLVYAGGGTWKPLKPGGELFGPEVSFGATMAAALKKPVGIVKVARCATNLAEQWNPATKGDYTRFADQVKAAQKSRPVHVAGMLWMQGESDAKDPAMAEAYKKNLAALVAKARADFQAPDMVFIAGRVNPPKRYPHAKAVRAALEDPGVPNYAWVDCDGLKKSDDLHYDAEGQVALGRLFAAEALRRLQKQ